MQARMWNYLSLSFEWSVSELKKWPVTRRHYYLCYSLHAIQVHFFHFIRDISSRSPWFDFRNSIEMMMTHTILQMQEGEEQTDGTDQQNWLTGNIEITTQRKPVFHLSEDTWPFYCFIWEYSRLTKEIPGNDTATNSRQTPRASWN